MPSILLDQYKFWQSEDDSLTGFMPISEKNKSIARSVLSVDILRIGLRDSTGFCNALADALISRMFIAENISQSISEKEFDNKPDTSKQVEYLVNLMSVLAHYVKKYNNTSDPPGPFSVPNMKVFLDLLCPFSLTFFERFYIFYVRT